MSSLIAVSEEKGGREGGTTVLLARIRLDISRGRLLWVLAARYIVDVV